MFTPPDANLKEDKFKSTNKEFYQNLARGQVDYRDFERYIYGGTYNKRNQDSRDELEDKIREDLRRS